MFLTKRILWRALFAAAMVGGLLACYRTIAPTQSGTLIVSAAADLTPPFQEIGKLFEHATGTRVTFNFGSTGQLAQQITQGAPVDLFAAANVGFIEELEEKGLIIPETKTIYGRGRITIWTRSDSRHRFAVLEDLTNPDIKKIAIANPDHAPYGVAAREALQHAGIWETVKPRLVYGENIRQTLQYAETGNVDAAIVALSLSLDSNGRSILIPESLHSPLNQALAVMRNAKNEEAAKKFAKFIVGEGRAVMGKYGFVSPSEERSP